MGGGFSVRKVYIRETNVIIVRTCINISSNSYALDQYFYSASWYLFVRFVYHIPENIFNTEDDVLKSEGHHIQTIRQTNINKNGITTL